MEEGRKRACEKKKMASTAQEKGKQAQQATRENTREYVNE
jgi:hypothetical protein